MKHHVRALHSFAPPSRDHFSALRVCTGLAIPSLTLLMFRHPELVIYALFGALTGMYGRTEPHQLRLQHQLQAAGMLVTGVMIGTGLSVSGLQSRWLVGVETLLAGVGSLVADRLNFKPSGPFFGILALGACASIPTTVPWLFAVLIGVASARPLLSPSVFLAGYGKGRGDPMEPEIRQPLPALENKGRSSMPDATSLRSARLEPLACLVEARTRIGPWRLRRYRLPRHIWPAAFIAESTGLWERFLALSSSQSFCCLRLGSWTHRETHLRW